jgi:hypothetical protein
MSKEAFQESSDEDAHEYNRQEEWVLQRQREQDAMEDLKNDDAINHPKHYTNSKARCPDCNATVECITVAKHMGFCLGNVLKYVWRAGEKGDAVEDLKKAAWYLQCEINKRCTTYEEPE